MNKLTLTQNSVYEIQPTSVMTTYILIKKICKIKSWFREVDGIIYTESYTNGNFDSYNEVMTVKKFHKIALRQM